MTGVPVADSSYSPGVRLSKEEAVRYQDARYADSLKTRALRRHHVAGVIYLPDQGPAANWETTVIRCNRFRYMQSGEVHSAGQAMDTDIASLLISPAFATELFRESEYNPVQQIGQYHCFTLSGLKLTVSIQQSTEIVTGNNLIAKCPGTDPGLTNETLVVGAHLDHIGRVRNHIYNGANDDGSGCVAVLATARAMAKHPAKRPVIFVCYTGEELNLLGSGYFVAHPPLPPTGILLNINLEQLGSKHRDFPGVWGIGDRLMERSFRLSRGRFRSDELKYDSLKGMEEVMSNCDSWPFILRHIPSVIIGSGGFPEHHTVEDKTDLIDFDHLEKAAQWLTSFTRSLADGGIRQN